MNKCPIVDPALVDHLQKQHPDSLSRIPQGLPEREFWIRYGAAKVVDYLRRQMDEQTKRGAINTP